MKTISSNFYSVKPARKMRVARDAQNIAVKRSDATISAPMS